MVVSQSRSGDQFENYEPSTVEVKKDNKVKRKINTKKTKTKLKKKQPTTTKRTDVNVKFKIPTNTKPNNSATLFKHDLQIFVEALYMFYKLHGGFSQYSENHH